ncbi:hypothetical protein [Candidatus Nanohalococcus occultus]|uniref:Ribosomal protein S3AE n=1 Tax=Candidatus Nanohalococcus occultus TaxID=2978047 RepID=A0ABY8CGY3_9ARCH|nr:Ribosomal protein S3AE [Candidatus Nanohaloarchaeota archaeon SVXNc]
MAKAVIQKNWYEIQAPEIFDADEVTETPAEKDSQVVGRKVREGLEDLMEGTDKYYADVTLKVTDVEGNKAFTEIAGMEVSKEYVSRMIRKRSDRFDLVHDTKTDDGKTVRIKVVGATVRNTSSKTLKDVRNAMKDLIDEEANSATYHEVMEMIFEDRLQDELRDIAEDIYPFRQLEIRKTELRD